MQLKRGTKLVLPVGVQLEMSLYEVFALRALFDEMAGTNYPANTVSIVIDDDGTVTATAHGEGENFLAVDQRLGDNEQLTLDFYEFEGGEQKPRHRLN